MSSSKPYLITAGELLRELEMARHRDVAADVGLGHFYNAERRWKQVRQSPRKDTERGTNFECATILVTAVIAVFKRFLHGVRSISGKF